MQLFDVVLKDKYGTGFGSSVMFTDKTEEQIKELIISYNARTPEIANRWRVSSKKPAARKYNKDAQPAKVGA